VVVLRGGEFVGCGRVVGDGGLYFYLQDIALLPEHQGRGLGAAIMDAVMAYLERTARRGAFIGLMAASDAPPSTRSMGSGFAPSGNPACTEDGRGRSMPRTAADKDERSWRE